eukprot:jgi/Mesen1/5151/ME000255S04117
MEVLCATSISCPSILGAALPSTSSTSTYRNSVSVVQAHLCRSQRRTLQQGLSSKSGSSLQGLQLSRAVANTHLTQRNNAAVLTRCMSDDAEEAGGSNLNIWLGRAAMLAFGAALSTEVITGKGVLENIGVTSPVPQLALGLTAVVGAVTAFGIFRSASRD